MNESLAQARKPPTHELTLEKLNRKGRQISDAIQEICLNLTKHEDHQTKFLSEDYKAIKTPNATIQRNFNTRRVMSMEGAQPR